MTHPKHASTDHAILDVIRHRWSPRAYDPDRPVGKAELHVLFEAARWAPSSFNEQPWRFVVANRHGNPEAFGALLATLSESNQTWARHAALLVLVASRTELTRTGTVNRHALYDTGQAVGFLTLQATGLGLGVRQMEGFDLERAREACDVPGDYDAVVVMAIGYPGDPDQLPIERHRTAERLPRQRQSAEEFVFDGRWGRPFRSS